MRRFVRRPVVASVTLVVAAGLAVGGCGSNGNSAAAGCFYKGVQPAAPGAAAGWTMPGVNLQNTRDVASPTNSEPRASSPTPWAKPASGVPR